MNSIETRFVEPLYLDLMGLSALKAEQRMPELVALAAEVTDDDVRWMLRVGAWRPVVMGAWFSLARPIEAIRDDLLRAMSAASGGLTAPPLAAVSVLSLGAAAAPALRSYLHGLAEQDRRDGSERFVAAALEHLGVEPSEDIGPDDRADFLALLGLAERLGDELGRPR